MYCMYINSPNFDRLLWTLLCSIYKANDLWKFFVSHVEIFGREMVFSFVFHGQQSRIFWFSFHFFIELRQLSLQTSCLPYLHRLCVTRFVIVCNTECIFWIYESTQTYVITTMVWVHKINSLQQKLKHVFNQVVTTKHSVSHYR